MYEWLLAYLITCAIEIPIVVALVRVLGWRARRFPSAVVMAWLLQLTHPVLWLIRPDSLATMILAEILIVIVEGLLLWRWATQRAGVAATSGSFLQAGAIALITNGMSLAVGLILAILAF